MRLLLRLLRLLLLPRPAAEKAVAAAVQAAAAKAAPTPGAPLITAPASPSQRSSFLSPVARHCRP